MTKPTDTLSNPTLSGYDLWSQNYDQFDNPMVAMVDWALANDPLKLKGHSVLELGCGTGRNLSKFLGQEITSYVGIDGSEGMLEKARSRSTDPNIGWIHSDLMKPLPVPSGAFDLVLVTLVLEHIADLSFLFQEIQRVLEHGGIFRLLEIHSDLVTNGTQAHFWHEGQEHRFESYAHDESEYRKSLESAGLLVQKVQEWQPPEELIAKMPKLSKHSGRRMIIDISARK